MTQKSILFFPPEGRSMDVLVEQGQQLEAGQGRPPTNSYDLVPYESHPFRQTHPTRLVAMGMLGMRPAPVASCRVLELGCAGSGNLIPAGEKPIYWDQ